MDPTCGYPVLRYALHNKWGAKAVSYTIVKSVYSAISGIAYDLPTANHCVCGVPEAR